MRRNGVEEWKECKLGDLCIDNKGSYGIAASAVPYSENLYTYLRITDINDDGTLNKSDLKSVADENAEQYILQPNYIVFARTGGSTGRNYFYDGSDGVFVYAGFLIKFSIDPNKVNPKYIKYFCLSQEYKNWVYSFNTGSTRGNINAQTYANMPVILPPRSQQDLLVRTLSSLDDKIELNNKINTNLEQQAQALFKNWFVDFEPFGGKMPEGWKEKTLDSFCSIFTGRKNANASVENGKYKFFTCSPNVLPIDSFIFDGDAIIISGNGAYTGRTRFYSGKFDLYQRTYACTMKKDQNQDYIFILYWIIKFVLSKKIMGGTHGSAIPYIVMDDIAKFVINYDKKVFDDLSKIMKSYVLQIQDNENQNEKLAELRDTLLPKLMNGEIEVDKVQL